MTGETIFIRLEKLPKGRNHAPDVDGRLMAKNWDKLNALAQEINAKPLDMFYVTPIRESVKEVWFQPSEALTTISKLISSIAANTKRFDQARLLIRNLNSYENILVSAQQRGSGFRFSVDQGIESDKQLVVGANTAS